MFITQMAALSTSDMSFDQGILMLSQRTDYGELAEDAKKIYRLMKHYNVGASEACRFVSVRAVSPMEMNFFNRLSHSLDVGEKLDRFMKNEHEVIMDEDVLKSESSIKDLDFIKEMYTGIVTALIFTTVFICIAPVLGVGDVSISSDRYSSHLCCDGGILYLFYSIKDAKGKYMVWVAREEKNRLYD